MHTCAATCVCVCVCTQKYRRQMKTGWFTYDRNESPRKSRQVTHDKNGTLQNLHKWLKCCVGS